MFDIRNQPLHLNQFHELANLKALYLAKIILKKN